jgi:voltage-gated sodium channel
VNLFGEKFPQWFGTLGGSLFSLFQILTLEGWADMAREVMAIYPWAPLFFVPFIIIATFTVLNLFIGIIVSTMQELATKPETADHTESATEILQRLEPDLQKLIRQLPSEQARD